MAYFDHSPVHTAPNMASSPVTSQILESRLNARRVDAKAARRRTDVGPVASPTSDDPFIAEAEASEFRSSVRTARPSTIAMTEETPRGRPGSSSRAIGLKEVDEKLQRLEKLNFDLKMEVFHRREREQKLMGQLKHMHNQVRKAERLQEEHATLLQLKNTLADELERSNEAVDQAVEMICNLEAELESFRSKASMRQPSSNTDSAYGSLTPRTSVLPLTADRSKSVADAGKIVPPVHENKSCSGQRIPSFMSSAGETNQALRETFTGDARALRDAKSFISIFSGSGVGGNHNIDNLDSPGLSVLSETSFPSFSPPEALDNSAERSTDREQPVPQLDTKAWKRVSHHEDSLRRVTDWVKQGGDQPSNAAMVQRGGELVPTRTGVVDADGTNLAPSEASSLLSAAVSTDRDSFTGFPDGGSIVTGTPSRFRISRTDIVDGAEQAAVNDHSPTRARPTFGRAGRSLTAPGHAEKKVGNSVETTTLSPSRDIARSTHDTPRQDSLALLSSHQVGKPDELPPRRSTRASLTAKTHKLFTRFSHRPRVSVDASSQAFDDPPPKPDMSARPMSTLPRSATMANTSAARGAEAFHTSPAKSSATRRRSMDPFVADEWGRRMSLQQGQRHQQQQQQQQQQNGAFAYGFATSTQRSMGPASRYSGDKAKLSEDGAKAAWEGRTTARGRNAVTGGGGSGGDEAKSWRA